MGPNRHSVGLTVRRRQLSPARLLPVAALSVALVTSACGASSNSADSSGAAGTGGTVKIGVVDALTGATALGGLADVCGSKVAVADVNASGGVMGGQNLELEVKDSQSQPSVAAQNASALTDAGVKLFASASSSAQLLAMLPILNDAGALHTGGVSKAPTVITSGKLIVRINSNGTQDAAPTGAYLKANAKTVVFVGSQGAYGEPGIAAIEAAMGTGVKTLKSFILPADTTDFKSTMTQVAALNADYFVYVFAGNQQTVALVTAYHDAQVKSKMLAPPGLLTPLVVQATGTASEGAIGPDLYQSDAKNEGATRLLAAWNKYSPTVAECKGVQLDDYIALSSGQIYLLAAAMNKTKSQDPKVIRDAIIAGTWDLPQGIVKFSADGQIVDPAFHWFRSTGGKVVPAPDITVN